MKRILQISLPFAFLAIAAMIVYYFLSSKEEPRQRKFQTPTPSVVTRVLEEIDFDMTLKSQGEVRARTQSVLVAEVRGRVIRISENFQEGAFFEKGDVLLELDKSDYETELIVAEGDLVQAKLQLFEEQARSEQAKLDWKRLNPNEEPNSLVLREPQLKETQASVAAARARVKTAETNLERTRITAPYAGRILSKSVDVGQYVGSGGQLADIYAVDFAEVRLPLTASQFGFLDLPNIYRGEDPTVEGGPKVILRASDGRDEYEWEGKIVRSEGAVNSSTRQIFVVAHVENPYGRTKDGRPPLKVGAFVEATIKGKTLENVFVLPRKLLRENVNVLTVDADNYLQRRKVEIAWQDDDVIVIEGGLNAGDRVCLTYVPFALEGWQVNATPEESVAAAENKEEKEVKRRRPSNANSQGGNILERIEKQLPKGTVIPGDLREKLEAASASGDMRSAMQELRSWAEGEGIELKLRRPGS
ncbi:efflux RND transporter periplasmic adaptor subunit [Puniceicoccaceae bacterium K14]|nr:efflux RND transporter periplasmic adaptor subunit [Puniceicoccaceae bacterium K14]